MSLSDIWDQFFKSFMIFVGVGIIWLRFIEVCIPDRKLSVTLMIIVAIVLAIGKFISGLWLINKKIKKVQAQIDAFDAQQEEAG